MPLLQEMQQITSKAKNPSLPTGAQLSKPDLDRFQQLRAQMLAFQAREIVESGYLRDSRVIARTAKVARDLSLGRTYDEKDPDFFYYSILMLIGVQSATEESKITTPKDGECSVEAGLHFYEQLTLKEINDLPFVQAVAQLKAVAQKYGLDIKQEGWVEKIPSPADKQSARLEWVTFNKGKSLYDYVTNLENQEIPGSRERPWLSVRYGGHQGRNHRGAA